MALTNTNFKVADGTDLADLLVRRDLFAEGNLYGWGYNLSGNVGTSDTATPKSTPVQITGSGNNWKSISTGASATGAIKSDGTLWMWGLNAYGQLGVNDTTARSSPIQVLGSTTTWRQVSCGETTTFAIKTDGTLWGWGRNSSSQLGTGNATSTSSPVQTAAGGNNWKQVSCAGASTGAIKTDGTLWSWGTSTVGGLGLNDTTYRSTPVQVGTDTTWKQVSFASDVGGAIKTDGTLWMWGYNLQGQLGLNDKTNRSSPVQITGGGTTWKQLSNGYRTGAATKTDGTLWLWGENVYGTLGTNNTTSTSSPVQTVTGGTNWKQVYVGTTTGSTCVGAVKFDGTLWMWGRNLYYNLGTGDSTPRSSPIQTIAGGSNWTQIAVAGDYNFGLTDSSL